MSERTLEQLMADRYSCRNYSDRKLEEGILNQVLEAGRLAPTAKNNQPQKIYVLESDEALAKINALCKSIRGAQTVLMVAVDTDNLFNNPFQPGVNSGDQDAAIVATHMMLEAEKLGLGTCWVNMFSPAEAAKAFGLPENEKVVLLMPIGYKGPEAAPSPRHDERKDLSETTVRL